MPPVFDETTSKKVSVTDRLGLGLSFAIEPEYSCWWSPHSCFNSFCEIQDERNWNVVLCIVVLLMLVSAITEYDVPGRTSLDILYNLFYGFYVLSVVAATVRLAPNQNITMSAKVGFLLDLVSYMHYVVRIPHYEALFKLVCYYVRLHRPFRYIYAKDTDNMQGSLLVTTMKYIYICLVLRATCAYLWLHVDSLEARYSETKGQRMLLSAMQHTNRTEAFLRPLEKHFFVALYCINKMFIPIGTSSRPDNDLERLTFLLVMIVGCLVVTGAVVASLSSVISIYMRAEENFRTRYRLIMEEMTQSHIPLSLRVKVETFYKMYWHKQRAVSATQLLPSFPPVLPKSVHTDIYFEATQKSRMLRDLTYQFLSELALKMETIHFIPGDSIIKRNSTKNSIIYIAYGDVEMLTAEDDISPILRFTRGTILTPFGVCPSGGGRAHVEIRAATFCTAHVLKAEDLWRVARKYGRESGETLAMIMDFQAHMEKVRKHYLERMPQPTKFKSSIVNFKRSLMALKEARDSNGELLLARTDYMLEIAGCYIMRNRADASLTDDSDAICLRQTFPCILQPTSSLLTAWHWLVAFLIVIVCFTYPYYLVFKKTKPQEFKFFDAVMTAVYVLDIITYLSTGSNVEEGVPITFLQTSAQQVMSTWFVLDVLATFPIFVFVEDGSLAGINKILRLPKVFIMMKSLESDCVYHSNMIRFLSYFLLIIIACYLIAALQQYFMCSFGYCLVTNYTDQPYWTEAPLDDDSVSKRLAFGLYWATSMITFTTHLETWGVEKLGTAAYTMLVLEVCIVLHIFIEAVYSATIMVTTAFREDYDACIANVKNFLIRNDVDPQLRQRFINYLQLSWYADKAFSMTTNQSSVFYDLPPHVYQDILARQRSKYILCIPFMKLLHKEDLKNVSSDARVFYTSPNEILLNTGDISMEMYVIKQGICQVLSPDTKEVVGTLTAKSHFGVLECLLRLPAFYTVRTLTHVQVFLISRKHLVRAIKLPQIKEAIEFAKEQEEYFRLLCRREPFVFYTPPPPAPTREMFRLPRKHETDYAFLQPFKKLGFFSLLRYVIPRYTFRPDSDFLTRYEVFRAICAFSTAMLFPSYFYMVLQFPFLRLIATVLDLLAIGDTLFRMLVGYYDENGVLVYHPASTAAHYLKGAYLMDIFSCLPLESLETSRKYSYGDFYLVTMTKQMLMMNRLLQLYRLPGAFSVLLGNMERQDFVLVLKALPLYLMMLNVLTSLLVFCSVAIYHSNDERHWLIIPFNDKGGSWIKLCGHSIRYNITASPWNLHLTCYFWIVYETTTTGYNNFNPSNNNIMNVLVLAMLLGTMAMTYVSVRIISIRANVNKVLAAYQEHMKDLVQFMRNERLSKSLQKELIEYYEYNWDKTGGVDYRHVLKLCGQITLRTDAILHLYGPAFAKCPILSDCDVSLLRILGRAVRSVYFLKQTNIFDVDDVIQDLYFVDSGCLEVRYLDDGIEDVQELCIGSVFGNLDDCAAAAMPAMVEALTDVHLLQMSSRAFHHIVRDCDFHQVTELMYTYRQNNETYIQGGVKEAELLSFREQALASHSSIRRRYRRLNKHSNLNTCLKSYNIIISMLCIYTDIYNAGFQDNRLALIVSLYVLDFLFVLKILVNYTLPFILRNDVFAGLVMMNAKEKYIKRELVYDVISCIPIELFSFLATKHRWMLFSWFRLNRMFRTVTVYASIKRLKERATANLILSTVVLVLWFTLFAHGCTCLWHFIGDMEARAQPRSSWLYDDDGNELCDNHYVCSLYFVLTTFSQNGVGDIMPKRQSEVLFVSMLQILTTMVYMVYMGEFSNIIQYASFRSFSYYSKYLELQKFLKNNRVSLTLVGLVNKYTVHLWREARGEQLPHFLIKAPRCLKLKVMSAAYMDELSRHPVFSQCEPALLRQIVSYIRQYYYNEDMYVVKENEITDSMYIVHTGKVEELCEEDPEEIPRIYHTGEYFGVFQGLVRDEPFPYSYRTLIKSQVLTLRLDDWEYLLEYFPKDKEAINKFQTYRGDDDDSAKETKKRRESKYHASFSTDPSDFPPTGPSGGPPKGPDAGPSTGPDGGPLTGSDDGPDDGPLTGPSDGPATDPGAPGEKATPKDSKSYLQKGTKDSFTRIPKVWAGVPRGAADPLLRESPDASLRGSASVLPRGSESVSPRGTASVSPRGSASVLQRGTVEVSPRGSASVLPRGSASVSPRGTVGVSPRGSASVLQRGTVEVSPRGSASVLPRGSASVSPRGTVGVSPRGSASVLQRGTVEVSPRGSASVLPRGSASVSPRGTVGVSPRGSASVLQRGTVEVSPRGSASVLPRGSASVSPRGTVGVSPRGSASVLQRGTVEVSPRGSASVLPRGSASVSPRGTVGVSPRGSASVLQRGTVEVSPRGSASVLPRGSASVSPRGTVGVSPRGSASVSPRGTVGVSPRGSASVLQRGTEGVSPRGSAIVLPRGSTSVLPRGSAGVLPRVTADVSLRGTMGVSPRGSASVLPREKEAGVSPRGSASMLPRGTTSVSSKGSADTISRGLTQLGSPKSTKAETPEESMGMTKPAVQGGTPKGLEIISPKASKAVTQMSEDVSLRALDKITSKESLIVTPKSEGVTQRTAKDITQRVLEGVTLKEPEDLTPKASDDIIVKSSKDVISKETKSETKEFDVTTPKSQVVTRQNSEAVTSKSEGQTSKHSVKLKTFMDGTSKQLTPESEVVTSRQLDGAKARASESVIPRLLDSETPKGSFRLATKSKDVTQKETEVVTPKSEGIRRKESEGVTLKALERATLEPSEFVTPRELDIITPKEIEAIMTRQTEDVTSRSLKDETPKGSEGIKLRDSKDVIQKTSQDGTATVSKEQKAAEILPRPSKTALELPLLQPSSAGKSILRTGRIQPEVQQQSEERPLAQDTITVVLKEETSSSGSSETPMYVINVDKDEIITTVPGDQPSAEHQLKQATSSTELFERIKQAAISAQNEENLESQEELAVSLDKKSVEDYLKDKYKMRDHYPVVPYSPSRAKHPNEVEDDKNEPSTSQDAQKINVRRNIRVRYEDESDSPVDQNKEEAMKKLRDRRLHRRISQASDASVLSVPQNQHDLESDWSITSLARTPETAELINVSSITSSPSIVSVREAAHNNFLALELLEPVDKTSTQSDGTSTQSNISYTYKKEDKDPISADSQKNVSALDGGVASATEENLIRDPVDKNDDQQLDAQAAKKLGKDENTDTQDVKKLKIFDDKQSDAHAATQLKKDDERLDAQSAQIPIEDDGEQLDAQVSEKPKKDHDKETDGQAAKKQKKDDDTQSDNDSYNKGASTSKEPKT